MSGFSASPRAGYGPLFRGSVAPNVAVSNLSVTVWTEDTDTHGVYGGGTGIITAPAGWGGLYHVDLSWKPNAATAVSWSVKKNGTAVFVTPGNSAAAFIGAAVSFIIDLAAGDGLSFQCSGAFTTTNDAATNTWCHVAWLRP